MKTIHGEEQKTTSYKETLLRESSLWIRLAQHGNAQGKGTFSSGPQWLVNEEEKFWARLVILLYET